MTRNKKAPQAAINCLHIALGGLRTRLGREGQLSASNPAAIQKSHPFILFFENQGLTVKPVSTDCASVYAEQDSHSVIRKLVFPHHAKRILMPWKQFWKHQNHQQRVLLTSLQHHGPWT